ncbi:MAG: hypothetical protein Tp178MES00d2C33159091_45 [Prokaryotic dsDNA virus sp.]|uniref:hypothetical protein n=1 Tax=Thalassospira sp. TaxID=1912094 RepID=UPI000C59DDC5|nr:hypothetical protein [Thalassospira sp.]QDP60994.1 MAG: hypothetical protein Tp178MES00d2C33159091_45 [Prokaryotic dsDNA virus sp.]MAZ33875.1 hypothetical protein [Thalassospira sp.]MAZ33931.1 hypothetical protein [Thalassospira sp.]MAZ34632.1 hypothetical protein [Thalassospira sp.]QDP64501.1 MAG: hypothetical protein Tp178SUR1139111_21 [Prokaryotic dsDNA virus sp.]|tara:strand:- start:44843 stop:46897 length:2055 start_codon:yes stop_codon:yes gene_type:complete
MGTKVTVDNVTNIEINSGVPTLNDNFDIVADEFDKVFYRDGSLSVTGNIDMDSNRLLNVPAPSIPTDVVRLQDLETVVDGAFLIQLNAKADIADVNAGLALKVDSADLSSEDGAELVGIKTIDDPNAIVRGLLSKIKDFGVWVTDFGADPTGVVDSAPAFRAARNYLALLGGGEIRVPAGNFRFASSETVQYWTTSEGSGQVSSNIEVCLMLTERIGLVGVEGSSKTKITRIGGSISSIIFCSEWGRARLGGLEIQGAGESNNSHHGIFLGSSTTFDHVMQDYEIFDTFIHHVGSYGLGNHMQSYNGKIRGLTTRATGADGLDWKIRGPNGLADIVSGPTYFDGIHISNYGKRPGAGQASGAGFRGFNLISNITVLDAGTTWPGINIQPGIAVTANGDFRPGPQKTTISNWFVQGGNPKSDNIGLTCFSAEGVVVGPGLAKWCKVNTAEHTASPYASEYGSTITSVTVIPCHGHKAFEISDAGSSLIGCRVISDKVYFDAKRANLTAGQTTFTLPFDTTTAAGVVRYVYKNGVALTVTTDYTWGSDSITLNTPVLSTDEIMVVFPPSHGFWWDAVDVHLSGCRQDRHVPNPATPTGPSAQNSAEVDVKWDQHAGITRGANGSLSVIQASNPTVTNQGIRIQGQGSGTTEINRLVPINIPTTAAAAVSGQIWYDPTDGNRIKYKP